MRKFLVVLDDTRECLNAMRFAAMRASKSNGGVVVLAVITPDEIQHGFGVADVMRAEAHERITVHYEVYAKWMRDRQGVNPELFIREGDRAQELLRLIGEIPDIGIVVLAASTDKNNPGPLITAMMRELGSLPCPMTIVPGDISKERLEQIT